MRLRILRIAWTPFSPYLPNGIPEVEEKNRQDIAKAESDLREQRQPLTGSRIRRSLGALRQWWQDERTMRQVEIGIRERNFDAHMEVANRKFAIEWEKARQNEEEFLNMSLRLVPPEVIRNYPLPGEKRKS